MENDHTKHYITISQNALTEDRLEVLEKGYRYAKKGKPCNTCIVYYTYATEWGDHENRKYFTSPEKAIEWYKREYKSRAASLEEWENLVYTCLMD